MQIFKLFSILVMIYSVVQGIIWLARGDTVKGIIILICAPILYLIYLLIRSLLRKKEAKIDEEITYSEDNLPKSKLFKDE
ncbi:MAG: hypothetical protein J5849_01180 [Clostridia bacterium]|nr:hypothetical protein [Clostridia bacterium]MBR5743267.1 hypothetical protein [Clostridia bacterium]